MVQIIGPSGGIIREQQTATDGLGLLRPFLFAAKQENHSKQRIASLTSKVRKSTTLYKNTSHSTETFQKPHVIALIFIRTN